MAEADPDTPSLVPSGSRLRIRESWNSQLGVILAVSGSAVGLGNFLRFPGQAAQFGGGAFMIAYFIGFLLIGLPICWAEWTMGRYGGQRGFHSAPGVFAVVSGRRWTRYLGVIGTAVPVCIYMYYVVVEAWCLGYAMNFLTGLQVETQEASEAFFTEFTGAAADGSAIGFAWDQVGLFLVAAFVLNFVLIYRGLAKGIEFFCRYAMPTLVVLAIIILVRVLTLGTPNPDEPYNNVSNGLGFMWNPSKTFLQEAVPQDDGTPVWTDVRELVGPTAIAEVQPQVEAGAGLRVYTRGLFEQLADPNLWLAAVGQIFFSLSVGFGVIIVYASYMSRRDDVVLSGLSAASANEFAEVGLGGLITLPAAVAFMGVAALSGMGTFGLGFNVLPLVFSSMPLGGFFGFLFFFLLFLAAVTSSLSMVQPGIAFLEESMNLNRKQSVAILSVITAMGTGFIVYASGGLKALDTFDFWMGTFMLFVLATIEIIIFSWVLGIKKGFAAASEGASFGIPQIFRWIMVYVTPVFLLAIFALWIAVNLFGLDLKRGTATEVAYYITDLFSNSPNAIAWMSIGLIALVMAFVAIITSVSNVYQQDSIEEEPINPEKVQ